MASYQWLPDTAISTYSFYTLQDSSTIYSVTVTDLLGCSSSATDTLFVNMKLSCTYTASVCYVSKNGVIDLTVSDDDAAPFSFQWSIPATTQNIINLPPGTYTVIVTDSAGCKAFDTVTLVANKECCYIPVVNNNLTFSSITATQLEEELGLSYNTLLLGSLASSLMILLLLIPALIYLVAKNVYMAPGAVIYVNPKRLLDIQHSNLRGACEKLWHGIVLPKSPSYYIDSGAHLELLSDSIRDAQYAVDASNHAHLRVWRTKFVSNFIDIYFHGRPRFNDQSVPVHVDWPLKKTISQVVNCFQVTRVWLTTVTNQVLA